MAARLGLSMSFPLAVQVLDTSDSHYRLSGIGFHFVIHGKSILSTRRPNAEDKSTFSFIFRVCRLEKTLVLA